MGEQVDWRGATRAVTGKEGGERKEKADVQNQALPKLQN